MPESYFNKESAHYECSLNSFPSTLSIQNRSSISLISASQIPQSPETLNFPVPQTNQQTMSKLITVFGATGNQGGSVIEAILADPQLSKEFKIRGITRDATKKSAQDLAKRGIEVVSVRISRGLPIAACRDQRLR
jgi:hypothetical protein